MKVRGVGFGKEERGRPTSLRVQAEAPAGGILMTDFYVTSSAALMLISNIKSNSIIYGRQKSAAG